MRRLDWSATPLGPADRWPQSLRTAVSILLNSRYPMFIAWGPQLAFLYNDGYKPIFGAKHPAALGQPFAEIWAEIWDDISPLVERALAGEATWSDDLRLFMARSGYLEEVYFTFSYSPVRQENGDVGGMFCACTETTGKVLGERRLRCLRDLAAAGAEAKSLEDAYARCLVTLETMPEDIPLALLYRSRGDGFELAGSSRPDVDRRIAPPQLTDADAVWPVAAAGTAGVQTVADVDRRFDGALRSVWGDPVNTALVVPSSDRGHSEATGALVLAVNTRRVLDDDYRSFLTLVASSVDTAAANARAFEEERRRAEALAEIDRSKTAFFANVSHEFRTPIALILSPIEESLARADLPAGDRRRLQVAHRNARRLLKMVNALLDFSRIEAGRMQATYAATDLATLTSALASNFRSLCERAGLSLVVDCPPLPEPVHVDRELWEKMVLNLISNAYKYTLHGEVGVRLRASGRMVEMVVHDTGIGIAASEIPKIFDRFARVERSGGRSHEGTGIGLALVRELVKLHGGDVRVDSTPEKGTSFTVAIPLGSDHLPQDQIGAADDASIETGSTEAFLDEAAYWDLRHDADPDAATGLSAHQAVWPADAMDAHAGTGQRRARILWVDDNADMRNYVRGLLDRYYRVTAVNDGRAALESAIAEPPDLVLSDVMLPRLDGLGLVRRLRGDPRTREVSIVLLSARAGEDAKVEGLEAGADDYLIKPFSARELLARVEAQLSMRQIRRQADAALRESEARFRNLADNAPVMVWVTEPDGSCSFLSRSWYQYTGQTPETGFGFDWLDAVHPDDAEAARQTFVAANGAREPFRLEYRLRQHDGCYRWAIDSAHPRLGGDGEFLGFIGSVIDIDERKRAEQQRALLVEELNHRVKNTLAVVQGLARQTFNAPEVPKGLAEIFQNRLAALAAAHNLLTRSNWENASLADVAADVLGAVGAETERITIAGPAVDLPARAALAMTMALNELNTNAVKYGALSAPGGVVSLTWETSSDAPGRLFLEWRESGGPSVQPPARRGFGLRMIEHALAQDLDGQVTLEFRPSGLVCTVEAPLPRSGEGSA